MSEGKNVLGQAARLLARWGIRPNMVSRQSGMLLSNPWDKDITGEYLTHVIMWLLKQYTTVEPRYAPKGIYITSDLASYPHLIVTVENPINPYRTPEIRVTNAFTLIGEELDHMNLEVKVFPNVGMCLATPPEITTAKEHILLALTTLFKLMQNEGEPFYEAKHGFIEIRDRANAPHRIYLYAPF